MEIQRIKDGQTLVLALNGRLDATWCPALEQMLSESIRAGEHHIHLDFEKVDYISSAGLRVLVATHRQLSGIKGSLAIRKPSKEVSSIFDLCGLWRVFVKAGDENDAGPAVVAFSSAKAEWEVHSLNPQASGKLRHAGAETPWEAAEGEPVSFPVGTAGIGVGAFGESRFDAGPRLGEFLAVGGCAAQLPPGGSMRPDFVITQEKFVPTVWVTSGLIVTGGFSRLLRFEAAESERTIGLAEIAEVCLGDSQAVFFAMFAETSGLVGATLQQPPDHKIENPFAFPEIRDRLGFTSERAFRDGTSLVVGVIAPEGGSAVARLRPIGGGLLGHIHAAAFPYRPIQKGRIGFEETTAIFFESQTILSVLHLINDPRVPGGAGDSEFYRGACWVSPLEQ